MTRRIDVSEVAPAGFRAVLGLEKYVSGAVDHTVLLLVKTRASMINGCTYCIHMHTNDAVKAGESIDRLFGLAAWHEAPFYDEAERAALALTDAVTRLDEGGVPDDAWDPAVKAWGEEGAANLLLAIATINVWNRIAITCRTPPGA